MTFYSGKKIALKTWKKITTGDIITCIERVNIVFRDLLKRKPLPHPGFDPSKVWDHQNV